MTNMLLWTYISLLAVGSVTGKGTCTETSYGREFIFSFADLLDYDSHGHATDPVLSVIVTSEVSTRFYITLPSTNSASKTPTMETTSYYAYRSEFVTFNSSFISRFDDPVSNNMINITAPYDISVLAMYKINGYVITSPILPVKSLSSSYVLPSYFPNTVSHSQAQVIVAALHDSTVVRLQSYDVSVTKTLKRNEVYVYTNRQDLSGMSVNSNHPIAVFSSVTAGSDVWGTHTGQYTGYLSMHVPPIGKEAKHFIVPALPSEVKSYKVRLFSAKNYARVEIHSTADSTKYTHVYEKIYYEYDTKGSSTLEILSDSPIMVVQIALSSTGVAMFMANIPAVSQFVNNYWTDVKRTYNSHDASSATTYIVTIQNEEAAGLLLDSKPVLHNPELVAHRSPLGNYSVFTVPMTSRDDVSHAVGFSFGLLVYGRFSASGFNNFAYGYYAGMELKAVTPTCDSNAGFAENVTPERGN